MKLLSLELKKVNIISYCIAAFAIFACLLGLTRSEERRVGKECRL